MCHLAAAQVASLIPTISRTPTRRPPGCSLALPPLQHPARQRIGHLLARLHSRLRLYNILPANASATCLLACTPASTTSRLPTSAASPCSLLTLPPPSRLPTRWPHLLAPCLRSHLHRAYRHVGCTSWFLHYALRRPTTCHVTHVRHLTARLPYHLHNLAPTDYSPCPVLRLRSCLSTLH
jgi:hypothetical protein